MGLSKTVVFCSRSGDVHYSRWALIKKGVVRDAVYVTLGGLPRNMLPRTASRRLVSPTCLLVFVWRPSERRVSDCPFHQRLIPGRGGSAIGWKVWAGGVFVASHRKPVITDEGWSSIRITYRCELAIMRLIQLNDVTNEILTSKSIEARSLMSVTP